MTTIAEIEKAIAMLPFREFSELGRWFDEQRQARWDDQMEQDAEAGKLDFLVKELNDDIARGDTRSLHELLRQP